MHASSSETVVAQKGWRSLIEEQKDALLCIIDQGVVSVAGFTTSVLIGKQAPEELGVYFIAMSIVLFIRGFQEQMISVPYTIFHHRYLSGGISDYRGSCLLQQFGLAGVALVFLAGLTVAASLGLVENSVVPALVVLLFLMPAILMREIIRQYCFTHQENVSVLAIDSAITALQIGTLIVLGHCGMLSGASAWAVTGCVCLLVLAMWYFQTGPEVKFTKERLSADWDQNWSFGKWAVGGQLVGSLPTYILPWLLAATAGTQGTGFFAAAMTLVGVANIFKVGMANFLTPKAAQVYVDEGAHGLYRVILRMSLIFVVSIGSFALFLALAGGWIAVQLYDSRYTGLQTAMGLLALAQLFEGLGIVASNGLFVMERIKANFWVDVVLMFITITVAILLVFPLGVMGAVWTALIGSVISAVMRYVLLIIFINREMNVGGSDAA